MSHKTQTVLEGEPVVSCRNARQMSGISEWFWRRAAYRQEVDSYKIGRSLMIPTREVKRVMAAGFRPRVATPAQAEVEAR